MLITAIICFALAALLGLYLLSFVLRNKNTPKGIAFIHGPLAAAGLILLIIYSFFHSPSPVASIVLFVLTALGGVMLIYRDLTGKSVPKWLAIGHGIAAVIAFIFLIMFTFVK